MAALAQSADLQVVTNFDADGKEGNLNSYSVVKKRENRE
jgi:hypothetical protein